jgi:hypothetical protein
MPGRAAAQLLSQRAHVDVDDARRTIERPVPDLFQDRAPAEDDVRLAKEGLEQCEGLRGQVQRPVAGGHATRGRIERDVADGQDRRSRRGTPARESTQPRQQLAECERLDEVVVATGIEALHPVVHRVTRREEEDGHAVPGGTQFAAEAEAVAVGDHHVEDRDVVRRLAGHPARVLDEADMVDRVPLPPEAAHEQIAQAHIVLEQQQLHDPASFTLESVSRRS